MSFRECGRQGFRSVLPQQCQETADLVGHGAVCFSQSPQIRFSERTDVSYQPLLAFGAFRSRSLLKHFLLEAVGAKGLASSPGPGITDDLVILIATDDESALTVSVRPTCRCGTR